MYSVYFKVIFELFHQQKLLNFLSLVYNMFAPNNNKSLSYQSQPRIYDHNLDYASKEEFDRYQRTRTSPPANSPYPPSSSPTPLPCVQNQQRWLMYQQQQQQVLDKIKMTNWYQQQKSQQHEQFVHEHDDEKQELESETESEACRHICLNMIFTTKHIYIYIFIYIYSEIMVKVRFLLKKVI